ncbi:MAG: hypothetical protein QXH08_03435 [Candidatus Hadarchaeales archaeon]
MRAKRIILSPVIIFVIALSFPLSLCCPVFEASNDVAWGWAGRTAPNPCAVVPLPTSAASLSAGLYHSLALLSDGTVVAWGDDTYGQCDVPPAIQSNVSTVAGGGFHSLALSPSGIVTAWGDNTYGQCDVPPAIQSSVSAIAGGGFHSLALLSDGTVVAWGSNDYGQCNVPPDLSGVLEVAAGLRHSLALLSDGTVVAWGDNTYGQCDVPLGLSNVVSVSAGFYHSLALLSDGTVVAWGNGTYRQLDIPGSASNVLAVSAGGLHSLALQFEDTAIAWGWDGYGQCIVPPEASSGVIAVSAGGYHSLALLSDGVIIAWGDNRYGQLDGPSQSPPPEAMLVTSLEPCESFGFIPTSVPTSLLNNHGSGAVYLHRWSDSTLFPSRERAGSILHDWGPGVLDGIGNLHQTDKVDYCVMGNVRFHTQVFAVTELVGENGNTVPINRLSIEVPDGSSVYLPFSGVGMDNGVLVLENVDPSEAGSAGLVFGFDLKITLPSNAPPGLYRVTLNFLSYQAL